MSRRADRVSAPALGPPRRPLSSGCRCRATTPPPTLRAARGLVAWLVPGAAGSASAGLAGLPLATLVLAALLLVPPPLHTRPAVPPLRIWLVVPPLCLWLVVPPLCIWLVVPPLRLRRAVLPGVRPLRLAVLHRWPTVPAAAPARRRPLPSHPLRGELGGSEEAVEVLVPLQRAPELRAAPHARQQLARGHVGPGRARRRLGHALPVDEVAPAPLEVRRLDVAVRVVGRRRRGPRRTRRLALW